MLRRIATLIFMCAIAAAAMHAQGRGGNEIGLLLGGTVTPNLSISGPPGSSIELGTGVTFQATYARRLVEGTRARLSLEVPFLAAPSIQADSANRNVPSEYASLFITPGLRVTLTPQAVVSPWLSFGGGYARFHEAVESVRGTPNAGRIGRNTGAAQFGGGLDIRTPVRVLFPISLRLEVRDIYSGKPTYNTHTGGGFQHNVVLSGGFVVHF